MLSILTSRGLNFKIHKVVGFTDGYPDNPLQDNGNESFPSRIEMLDSLGGNHGYSNRIKRVVSQIKYKSKEQDGSFEYVSPPIYKGADAIRFNFLQQQKTIIYIDPSNKSNYYFDIDFLR